MFSTEHSNKKSRKRAALSVGLIKVKPRLRSATEILLSSFAEIIEQRLFLILYLHLGAIPLGMFHFEEFGLSLYDYRFV